MGLYPPYLPFLNADLRNGHLQLPSCQKNTPTHLVRSPEPAAGRGSCQGSGPSGYWWLSRQTPASPPPRPRSAASPAGTGPTPCFRDQIKGHLSGKNPATQAALRSDCNVAQTNGVERGESEECDGLRRRERVGGGAPDGEAQGKASFS